MIRRRADRELSAHNAPLPVYASRSVQAIILILVLFWLGACHSQQTQRISAQPDAQGSASSNHLQWFLDAQHVLIGKQWVYSLATKRFTPVTPPPGVSEQSAGSAWQLYPYTEADQLLWFDNGSNLYVQQKEQRPLKAVTIPDWSAARGDDKPVREAVFNTVFWLNARQLFVRQSQLQQADQAHCAIYTIKQDQWSPLDCPALHFYLNSKAQPLSSSLYAFWSSAEGMNALDVVQIRQDTGLQYKRLATLSFNADSPLQLSVKSDTTLSITFPCALSLSEAQAAGEAIHCQPQGPTWSQLDWNLDTGQLRPSVTALAPRHYVSLDQRYTAWLEQGRLCLRRNTQHQDTTACHALPHE